MEACNDLLVLIWWLERMGMKAWFVGVVPVILPVVHGL
jgi:hypothetical protein